jgi:hypothetical protein
MRVLLYRDSSVFSRLLRSFCQAVSVKIVGKIPLVFPTKKLLCEA